MTIPANNGLPPVIDAQLDGLLERWAEHYRLSPAQQETILRDIQVTAPDLSAAWWQDFWASMTASLVQATSVPVPPLSPRRAGAPRHPKQGARPYVRLVSAPA